MKLIKLIILILSVNFIFNSNAGLLRKFSLSVREWKKVIQFVLLQRKLKRARYAFINPDHTESFEKKKQILDQMFDNVNDQGADLIARLKEEMERNKNNKNDIDTC